MLTELLVGIIILALIYWAILQLPLPNPFAVIVRVIFIVIVILWLVGFLPHQGGSIWPGR